MSSIMMPQPVPTASSLARKTSLRRRIAALGLTALVAISAPAQCQEGREWDLARARLIAEAAGPMSNAIARWRSLSASDSAGFDAYASFTLAYPGFPQEEQLRRAAEKSLDVQNVDAARQVAFFDRFAPLTNPARARYALALAALGRREAAEVARAAWRGGTMSDTAEQMIASRWGASFTQADHDARLESLLWDGNSAQAARALMRASAYMRPTAQARLAMLSGPSFATSADATPSDEMARATAAANPGLYVPPASPAPAYTPATPATPAITGDMLSDPGFLVDRARYLTRRGRSYEAAQMLASHPTLSRPALDPRRWTATLLAAARGADTATATAIALSAAAGFGAGADISAQAFAVRDDYTSLMWLGASGAFWQTGDAARAAELFWRYGTAARTPQTRAKGFYWAGRATLRAGNPQLANHYFDEAARYADQYYGQLALERLGRPMPDLRDPPHPQPSEAQTRAFYASPIAQAVREVAREADWQTTIRFFREIANQAHTETDFVGLANYARQLGRRDLAVIAGQAAENEGLLTFRELCFPLAPSPEGADWTMVHAIARQESQFSQNAISRTGARGLMQLMPGTAADQARLLGLPFSASALSTDPLFNMRLGDTYFAHLMDIYNGSYPLAVAAYNAGPGNVNHWLRAHGDPRVGGGDWVDWLEHIPISETRGYVQHVLENAVVYEQMNPSHARYRGPNPISHFIGKPGPG